MVLTAALCIWCCNAHLNEQFSLLYSLVLLAWQNGLHLSFSAPSFPLFLFILGKVLESKCT